MTFPLVWPIPPQNTCLTFIRVLSKNFLCWLHQQFRSESFLVSSIRGIFDFWMVSKERDWFWRFRQKKISYKSLLGVFNLNPYMLYLDSNQLIVVTKIRLDLYGGHQSDSFHLNLLNIWEWAGHAITSGARQ